ncbi:MAG: serine hydrolase domain-containing protein [Candidatus Aminicenantaceae bacterium]
MKNHLACLLLFLFIVSFSYALINDSISLIVDRERGIVEGVLGRRVDKYLSRISPFGFSGALLVAKSGNIMLNKGYGVAIRSLNVPNTSETVFSTGSVTKQFTAAGIMKLEMRRKLSTDDPISKFFKNVPREKKGITIHHLLTHTSGVVNFTGMDYERAARDETVQKILDAPLLFKPGERFGYSNAGYSMLAAIIEKVSRKSYEEFLNEQLFKPAGMEFTGYRMPQWDKRVVAHWYVGDKDNGTPLEKSYPYWNLLGNGGILSTIGDMYKWHIALNTDEIISAEVKKKIFTPYLNDYGYGWDVLKTEHGTLIQHDGGSLLGNSAEMRRYIDADVVTILFCNQSYGRKPLFEVVRDNIETLVFGGNVVMPPSVITLDNESLKKFEGKYLLSSGGELDVEAKGGGLVVHPKEEDAITTFFSIEKADSGVLKELNKLSVSIFEAALKGDYKPFGEVLFNKEKRLERVRQFIEMRIRRYKKRTGEIQNVIAVGTFPSGIGEESEVRTCIQLKGEKGSIFFEMLWRDKKNIGIGPLMSALDTSIAFMATSRNEFAGYRLDLAYNVRISLNVGGSGFVKGLTVHGKDRELSASKVEEGK